MFTGLRYRRFHISYLIGWLALGVCGGLLSAKYLSIHADVWWLVIAVVIGMGAVRSRNFGAVGLIIFSGVLIGVERGSSFLVQLEPYRQFVGSEISVQGVVAVDPQLTKRSDMRLDINSVVVNGSDLPGELYVTTAGADIKRGDLVKLGGKASEGFGSYQLSIYQAEMKSVTRSDDIVRDVRERFGSGVRAVVEEPEASLGLGFVVGQRSALPSELDDQLRAVGLTHIVVASGYNLTILVRFARRLLARVSRYLATVSSLFLMSSFALFSGFSPSMNRAVLVTGLSLLAWHYGRKFHPLLLILYVSAATAYFNPVYIWGDIGWYLSFLAFAGILIVAPLLAKMILRDREPGGFLQVMIETTAAQAMTLPVILLVFGQMPNLALLANMLVAPVIPFAMAATVVAGLIGMLIPAALIFGSAAELSIGYIVAIVDWLNAVPGAQTDSSLTMFNMLLIYGVIVAAVTLLWRRAQFDFRSRSIVE